MIVNALLLFGPPRRSLPPTPSFYGGRKGRTEGEEETGSSERVGEGGNAQLPIKKEDAALRRGGDRRRKRCLKYVRKMPPCSLG